MNAIPVLERRTVRLDEMQPSEYNPRIRLERGTPAYAELRQSLIEFGETGGIVWNEDTGRIVGGHQRYFVLLDEGVESADVTVVHLDEEHERALNIRLNKPASDWDLNQLAVVVNEMESDMRRLAGMQDAEVVDLLRHQEALGAGGFLDDLATPPPMPGPGGAEGKADHPHRTGPQYFQFQAVLTAEQREIVHRALDRAKANLDLDTTMDALVAVCEAYIREDI